MANPNIIDNNARLGFTLQRVICEQFDIRKTIEHTALLQFYSSYDLELERIARNLSIQCFALLRLNPIECTTFKKDKNGIEIPYNFVLSDGSTLSIRTNMKGCKVAPRIVGQAGFPKLNEYFGSIYKKEIEDQIDIKHLITEHIDEVLPIFFDHLFDADYILWINNDGDKYTPHLISGDLGVNIDFEKANFSFSRNFYEWTESTTLKYKGISIAEIQIHKARSFKFRFIMKNILPFLYEKDINTETLGITAEKTICDIFGLECPPSFNSRYSPKIEEEIKPTIKKAFLSLPDAIRHTGSEKGERGGESKCSYDFILKGNKTLSLKTNVGKMVCPPEVGQPGASTCFLYFKKYIDGSSVNEMNFKNMVYNHIQDILPIYIEHMFDSDYLLWIFKRNDKFAYKIIEGNYASSIKWDAQLFSFTKERIEDWNESNTLKYNSVSIGEFQVHKNRDCFKFRFNFENFIKVVEDIKND